MSRSLRTLFRSPRRQAGGPSLSHLRRAWNQPEWQDPNPGFAFLDRHSLAAKVSPTPAPKASPAPTRPTERGWGAWTWGIGAGLAWVAAHFLLFLPESSWSDQTRSDWDILLAARAFAAGEIVTGPVGSIQPWSVGSYVVSMLLSWLLRLGIDPITASRLGASMTGAATITATVWLTYRIAESAGISPHRAAAIATGLLALCWPYWHLLHIGLNGSSIEAMVPLLIAFVLALGPDRERVWSAAAIGALLSMSLLFSPAASLAVPVLLLLLWAASKGGTRTVRAGAALAGASLPPALVAVLIPQGPASLGNVLRQLSDNIDLSTLLRLGLRHDWPESANPNSVGEAVNFWGIFRTTARFFLGDTTFESLPAQPVILGGIGALVLGVLAVLAITALAVGTRTKKTGAGFLGRTAGGWLLMLVFVGAVTRGFPDSYRYWSIYGFLAVSCSAIWATRLMASLPSKKAAAVIGTGIVALTVPPILDNNLLWHLSPTEKPDETIEEVFLEVSFHRTNLRVGVQPGSSRAHGTFADLAPHVPEAQRRTFALGYGLKQAEVFRWEGCRKSFSHDWDLGWLWTNVPPTEAAAVALGLGCGLSVLDQDPEICWRQAPLTPEVRGSFFYGLGWCGPRRWSSSEMKKRLQQLEAVSNDTDLAHLLLGFRDAGISDDDLDAWSGHPREAPLPAVTIAPVATEIWRFSMDLHLAVRCPSQVVVPYPHPQAPCGSQCLRSSKCPHGR